MKPFEPASGITVRIWTPADATAMFDTIEVERDRLAPWMPWVPFTTSVEDVRAYLERTVEAEREGRALSLGIFEGESVVGAAGATIGEHNYDEADVGYWIASTHEGSGLIGSIVSRIIDWLVTERDMHRITIRAAVGNARSIAVAERLGFTYEGILRRSLLLKGEHVDAALYSLLAEEWRGS